MITIPIILFACVCGAIGFVTGIIAMFVIATILSKREKDHELPM